MTTRRKLAKIGNKDDGRVTVFQLNGKYGTIVIRTDDFAFPKENGEAFLALYEFKAFLKRAARAVGLEIK